MDQQLGDKVLKDIKSDFMVQGTHRVHNWYAYAIIGIVFGLAVGIIYVANRNAKFDASQASTGDGAKPDINDPWTLNGNSRTAMVPDREGPWMILATLQPGEAIKATRQDNGSTVLTGPNEQVLKLISDGEGGALSREGDNMIWVPAVNMAPAGGTPIKLENGQSMTIGLDSNNSSGGIVVTLPRTSPSKPPVQIYGFVLIYVGSYEGGVWVDNTWNAIK